MKIKRLKSNVNQHQSKPVLCDNAIKTNFDSLHRRFASRAVEKVANNYALICKIFYINRLPAEVGIFNNCNTKTYSRYIKRRYIKRRHNKYSP